MEKINNQSDMIDKTKLTFLSIHKKQIIDQNVYHLLYLCIYDEL